LPLALDRKLTWIGVGAEKVGTYRSSPLIAFEHFQKFDADGDDLASLGCTALTKRFYTHPAPRYVLDDFSAKELAEIRMLLEMVKDSHPSKGRRSPKGRGKCPPKSPHDDC
jgi:hypothetical protein